MNDISTLNRTSTQFKSFISSNKLEIEAALHSVGCDFIAQVSDTNTNNLLLDNRFHYLNRQKNVGYIGELRKNRNNIPFLSLTFNDFKCPKSFRDSYDVIKTLYESFRSGAVKSRNKQLKQQVKPAKAIYRRPNAEKLEANQARENKLRNRACRQAIDRFTRLPALSAGKSVYLQRAKVDFAHHFFRDDSVNKRIGIIVNSAKTNVALGVQWLHQNGDKKFNFGIKIANNSGCVPIGLNESLESPAQIYLCEGVKDAIVINHATNAPAIACLSANNVERIAKVLKNRFPNTQFVVCADNDKVGIEYALKASKAIGASFCIPNEKDIADTFLASGATGGISGVQFVVDNPYNTDFVGKFIKDDLGKSEYKSQFFNGYVSDNLNIINDINNTSKDNRKIFAIKSTMGTGKTTAISEIIKHNKNVGDKTIVLNPLRKFLQLAAFKLNIPLYRDKAKGIDLADAMEQYRDEGAISISYNSLNNPIAFNNLSDGDVTLVIDEPTYFLRFLFSGAVKREYKTEWFINLKKFLKRVKKIVLLDADLDAFTIDKFVEFAGLDKSDVRLYVNPKKAGAGKTATRLDNKKELYHAILAEFEQFKKGLARPFIVASDNNEYLKKLHESMKNDDSVIIINSSHELTNDIIREINTGEKIVLYSPSISRGFDINVKQYTKAFTLYSGVILPVDFYQMMNRARHCKKFVFAIDLQFLTQKNALEINTRILAEQHIKKYIKTTETIYDSNNLPIEERTDYSPETFYIEISAKINQSFHHYDRKFIALLEDDGVQINRLERNDDAFESGKQAIQQAKKILKVKSVDTIMNMNTIDNIDARDLVNKSKRENLNESEQAELAKYRIIKDYLLDSDKEMRTEHVQSYLNGGLGKLKNLHLYTALPDVVAAHDFKEVAHDGISPMFLSHHSNTKHFIDYAFNILFEDGDLTKPVEYGKKECSKITHYFLKNYELFNDNGLGRNVAAKDKSNPIKFVNEFLRNGFGLETENRVVGSDAALINLNKNTRSSPSKKRKKRRRIRRYIISSNLNLETIIKAKELGKNEFETQLNRFLESIVLPTNYEEWKKAVESGVDGMRYLVAARVHLPKNQFTRLYHHAKTYLAEQNTA